MSLKLARFQFTLQPTGRLLLPPYAGSTLRGGFGHAFRRAVCLQQGMECAGCLLRERCVYVYIFDTPPPPQSPYLRKVPTAPHPFVLEPPRGPKRVYEPGELLTFHLLLLGRAIDYLPYFIFTFDQLGGLGLGKGNGKYRLEEVQGVDGLGEQGCIIYRGRERILSGDFPLLEADELLQDRAEGGTGEGRLVLDFLTPTRIKSEGNLQEKLAFPLLVRNLLWRLQLLSCFHGEGEPGLDHQDLIARAGEVVVEDSQLIWEDWERYSGRQKVRMKLGGFQGRISFEGPWQEFLPLLQLGELIHVGKGSSFGLGQYRIAEGD